jgi:hypothetical protein
LPNSLIGDEGMDYIALTCSRSGAYFLPRPRQDIGIDGSIELRNEQGDPTGAIALIQSKAGPSYITSSGKYRILADKHHFQTWSKYTLPVIGIVYNPKRRDARWVNISGYLEANPSYIENGPYVIEAPAHQPFTEEAFSDFQNTIEEIHRRIGSKSVQQLINLYLIGDNTSKDVFLTELFSEYYRTPLVCFFVHEVIRIETDEDLLSYLFYLISIYRAHGDRLYDGEYSIPYELNSLADKCISGFDIPEIIKFLSAIDPENGIERGSEGQTIAMQLIAINNIVDKLCLIAKSRKLDTHIRGYAIAILVEILYYKNIRYFRAILKAEKDPYMMELLQWAIEYIEEAYFNK